MVDRYWREIGDIKNDIENAMEISSILLKLKEYDDNLGKIDTNENNISSNSGLISTNTNDISDNSGLVSTNEGNISSNSEQISTNTGNISSNLSKLNNIENNLILVDDIYNETFPISRFSVTSKDKRIFYRQLYSNFTTNGIIKINAKYNYVYNENYTLQHVYRFYNNKRQFKKIELQHDRLSKVINDKFEVQGIDSNQIDIAIYYENNTDSKKIELVGINTIQINCIENNSKLDMNKNNISDNLGKINDNSGLISTNTSDISSNSGLISTNTSNISSNLEKINTNTSSISDNSGLISINTSDIASNLLKINDLQNSNIKAFYNLDQIFIYDIEKGNQTVNKNNHFHIFEKEIIHDFTKNSYLEIILKVLTEISNYVSIGFFQILCNFYDQDNNLFYTISLSTAAGGINKLSTIKSVFIVPINENMSKIKIDFFIVPKISQENRTAKFNIIDINSNKIYVKYFQKTDEMSIKDIQDRLNTVNSMTSRIDKIENKLYLKNLYNDIYHDNDVSITNIFFDKTYTINAKRNDFIEIYFKLLIKYDDVSDAKHITTNFILYDMNNGQELISYSYDNSDYIGNSNTDILLNNAFYYNFDEDINKVKIAITFTKRRSYVKISYSSINSNRLIVKHYGN